MYLSKGPKLTEDKWVDEEFDRESRKMMRRVEKSNLI